MIFEAMGAMLLTFLYLTQTEEKTKLSGDPAITTLIISATYSAITYLAVAIVTVSSTPFNPAIALGEFWAILFSGNFESNGLWIFMTFGYAGALLAVVLFEFVYKKAVETVDEVEQIVSDDDEGGDKLLAQGSM